MLRNLCQIDELRRPCRIVKNITQDLYILHVLEESLPIWRRYTIKVNNVHVRFLWGIQHPKNQLLKDINHLLLIGIGHEIISLALAYRQELIHVGDA